MLYVATLQAAGQAWSSVMMILLTKEFLEEIHGYSLQEAAMIVTIPSNVAQFVLTLLVGSLGDWLDRRGVPALTVRRLGAAVQILSVLPLFALPFLPCSVVSYRATMVVIQVLCSFRVFGNLAAFSSYRDISPTFHRHLFGCSSIVSLSVPGILVPALMGTFGTTKLAQWRLQLPVNCGVVILCNLVYILAVKTEPASWEPGPRTRSADTVTGRWGTQGAAGVLAEGEAADSSAPSSAQP
jgi:hypothetical protein